MGLFVAQQIDLNADLGESFGPWTMGDDGAMLDLVSSANIACGGHAGDPEVMFRTLQEAASRGVVIGAHPGYPDREGFGRRIIPMSPPEIARMIAAQIGALQGVAALAGAEVSYVKLHGALANLAAADETVAATLAEALAEMNRNARTRPLALLAISGTRLEEAALARGLPVHSEIFADRGYLANGQLVPRNQPGAMIHDPEEAAARLTAFLESGLMPVVDGAPIPLRAQSICVHGDSAGAVAMARCVRDRLEAAGFAVRPFLGTVA